MKKCLVTLLLCAPIASCVSLSPPGHYSDVINDLDNNAPLPDVIVVGVFGYEVQDVHEGFFRCTGIEVRTTDATGRVSFTRGELPARVFAYKEGYWPKDTGSDDRREPRPFGMTRKDPLSNTSPESRKVLDPKSALARRLDVGRQIELECDTLRSQWAILRPLRVATTGEALRFATDDEEKALALNLCRELAAEGDNGGRVFSMGDRFVFTGIEASRLKELSPGCLDRELLLFKMRHSLQNVPRANALSPEELLRRAIVDDPGAYVQSRNAQRTIWESCTAAIDTDALACCIMTGVPQRFSELIDRVRTAGIRFVANDRGVCVRRSDVEAVSHLAAEIISDL